MEEAKGTLEGVQRILAARQVEEYVDAQRRCPACDRQRPQKGRHEIVYRTLFGRLHLESPRLYECRCQVPARKSFSPLAELLPERTAPELAYLEAKWAALIPFHATSELLAGQGRRTPEKYTLRPNGFWRVRLRGSLGLVNHFGAGARRPPARMKMEQT